MTPSKCEGKVAKGAFNAQRSLCGPWMGQQDGGNRAVVGTKTGGWRVESIGDRWWLVTPEGHGAFIRRRRSLQHLGVG